MKGTTLESSKIVYKATLFNVTENKVVYPDGTKHTHHDVYRHPSVSIFPLTSKKEIYLVKQYRYLLGKECLEAVAGMVDEGESSLKAAKRELREEAGILAGQWELMMKVEGAASIIRVPSNLFLCRELEVVATNFDDSEEIELVKMPLTAAVEKIMNGEITSTSTIIGLLYLDKLRRERKL